MIDEDIRLKRKRRTGVRTLVLCLYELGKFGLLKGPVGRKIDDWGCLLQYTNKNPGTRRKTPVNVKALVKAWVEAVLGMTLAHEKKKLDEWEYSLNELLTPLLTAPVKQVREFYHELCVALQANKKVPFFVWQLFASWGKYLDDAPDEGVIELKKEIAGRIARLVEPDVTPQLAEVIANALQWRDPKTLKKIEKAAKSGQKARLTGKESCLFLCVGDETVML